MRKAMYEAEVGDDVLGDDPTVKKLEEIAAEKIGKESALFVPSGSMGNAICVKLWTKEGDEVIVEERSHIYNIELGNLSVISRVLPRPVPSRRGEMAPIDVERAIRKKGLTSNETSLICLENTHNFWSGAVVSVENFREIRKIAQRNNIKIHLDGARIFNASIAKKIPVTEWTSLVDSVMFCLSKGLSAPIGSIVAGSKEFIEEARRVRKLLGGGMRQVGVIASAGIVALQEMIERLEEDHILAKKLANGLAEIKGVELDPKDVETNIIIFKIKRNGISAPKFVEMLKEKGILALSISEDEVRFCTHKDVNEKDVERALKACREILQ
jgi:threonine aldolase